MNAYNTKMPVSLQVDMEELLGSKIHDSVSEALCSDGVYSEEDSMKLGKEILRTVISAFRPDLMSETEVRADGVEETS